MNENINYDDLRNKLCKVIGNIRSFSDMSEMNRRKFLDELIGIFDEIYDDVDHFKYDILNYIPHTMFEEATNIRNPVFLTTPFQLH